MINGQDDIRKKISEDFEIEEILQQSRAYKMKQMKLRASEEVDLDSMLLGDQKKDDDSDDEFYD